MQPPVLRECLLDAVAPAKAQHTYLPARQEIAKGIDGRMDAFHAHGNFTEPHDVGPHARWGGAARAIHEGERVKIRLGHALLVSSASLAPEHAQLAVHGQQGS